MRQLLARAAARIAASGRVQWWVVFLPVLMAYVATLRTVATAMSADPTGVTPSAWGMAHFGSPVIDRDDWPFFNPWDVTVSDDRVVSNRTPGLVYLATPFYWAFGNAGTWDPLPASLAAAVVTAAAMATLGILVRRMLGPSDGWKVGTAAAYVAAFATTNWAVSGTQLFPHGPDALLLVLAMVSMAGVRPVRSALACGLAFAAAVLIRPPLAVIAACLGLARSWRLRSVVPAAVIGALTAVGLLLFAWYSHQYWSVVVAPPSAGGEAISHGVINPTATHGYGDRLLDWSEAARAELPEKILGPLFSPGRGVLVGAPFLLLLLPGLRKAWDGAGDWVRASAIGGIVYLLIQLKAEPFAGGSYFWSYRYPLEPLILWAPLLVLCWQHWTSRTRVRRAWLGALVAVAVGMQALGAIYFHGPYPDTPWTFDNLAAALERAGFVAGPLLLGGSALVAAVILWRGYRAASASVERGSEVRNDPGQMTTPTSAPSP